MRSSSTGQHYDPELSAVFFEELELAPPRYRLETGSGTHGSRPAGCCRPSRRPCWRRRPMPCSSSAANSTLAGALAAGKLLVPVAHVEAGLRSFDRTMPEELNRMLVDRMSSLLFCPTDVAVGNLAAEGIDEGVHLVGDVMYDANLRPRADRARAVERARPERRRAGALPRAHAPPRGQRRAGAARAHRRGASPPGRAGGLPRRTRGRARP